MAVIVVHEPSSSRVVQVPNPKVYNFQLLLVNKRNFHNMRELREILIFVVKKPRIFYLVQQVRM